MLLRRMLGTFEWQLNESVEAPAMDENSDAVECALFVEIASDTEAKITTAQAKIVKVLLDSNWGDVMVTVHRAPPRGAHSALAPHD
jgi:hypothetical protein